MQTDRKKKQGAGFTAAGIATLIIVACFMFYKYVLQISPSVMSHELMRTFSLDATDLGFMAACYFYTYGIFQIPAGLLIDRYGLKKLLALMVGLAAIGALVFSQTDSFTIANTARALIGVGAAFASVAYMKAVSLWVPSRLTALFTGLFGTAAMLGATSAGAPIALLTNHMGWRNTLFAMGIIGAVLVILVLVTVKDKPCKPRRFFQRAIKPPAFLKTMQSIVRNKNNWWLLLFSGLAFTPVSVYGGLWGTPFLQVAYGLSKTQAAFSASLIFFGLAVGGPIIGLLSDRFHRRIRVILAGMLLALTALTALLYVPNLSYHVINALTFLIGFGVSSFLICFTITKETNSLVVMATAVAFINMGDPILGSIAEPLIGKILDLNWHGVMLDGVRHFTAHEYRLALVVLPAYLVLSLVTLCFIREGKRPK